MHFHLAHLVMEQPLHGMTPVHGMQGYKEVIDTVQWGLQQLGHSVDYGVNTISPIAINIVFGAQILSMKSIKNLPPRTIIYNFEQMGGQAVEDMKPQMFALANRCRIWDYSEANMGIWAELGAEDIRLVPIGYAPILQRIFKPQTQDIDVLMYGTAGPERLTALHRLSLSGLTIVFVCGLYGQSRDDLISRAKLVVNANVIAESKIFEIVRVSYLLANRKAVVAVVDNDTAVDEDIRSAIRITSISSLVSDCQELIRDDIARAALEELGFLAIQNRDVRTVLKSVL